MTTNLIGSDPEAPESAWQEPDGLGHAIVVGCTVGALSSFVGVVGAMVAFGESWGASVGLGLFIAFWGGLGFGSMIGGVIHASRLEVDG